MLCKGLYNLIDMLFGDDFLLCLVVGVDLDITDKIGVVV